jgi:hypothetical protein
MVLMLMDVDLIVRRTQVFGTNRRRKRSPEFCECGSCITEYVVNCDWLGCVSRDEPSMSYR